MLIIPALGRLRRAYCGLQIMAGYIKRACLIRKGGNDRKQGPEVRADTVPTHALSRIWGDSLGNLK